MSKAVNSTADALKRMKEKSEIAGLKALVIEVLGLCGEINLPIPVADQPKYLNAKTTHEYYIENALCDPQEALKCFTTLKKELSVESSNR